MGSSVCGILQAKYWSGLPCPPPGDLPDPRIKPKSLKSLALAGRFVAQLVKNPSAMQETLIQFLDQEDPLEKE